MPINLSKIIVAGIALGEKKGRKSPAETRQLNFPLSPARGQVLDYSNIPSVFNDGAVDL